MAKMVPSSAGSGNERIACFVCDIAVVGRYYALANCRTQVTKVRLIEKLGQLVGDDYMVVVSEDDIICRGCATMINSLDRLEKELTSLRSMVLRYLERKYDLHEGELVNTRSQIAPRESKPEPVKHDFVDFHTRKRRAMSGEVDIDELKDTRDAQWLQCDRCKYTTQQNPNNPPPLQQISRPHPPPSQPPLHPPSKPSVDTTTKPIIHAPRTIQTELQHSPMLLQQMTGVEKQNGGNSVVKSTVLRVDGFSGVGDGLSPVATIQHVVEAKKCHDPLEGADNVEMMTADIGHPFQSESADDEATIDGAAGDEQVLHMTDGKQVTLQTIESEDGTNDLCMVDENGVVVQKVEQAEDGSFYVQMADNGDPTKQMLSVGEDGSVQMVEVLWDEDIGPTDDSEAHAIVNF